MDSSNRKKFCVAGVDYSAARPRPGSAAPNATWLAAGEYEEGRLTISRLENIGSHMLLVNLKKLAADTAGKMDLHVGLDFPFSLPIEAAQIIAASNFAGRVSNKSDSADAANTNEPDAATSNEPDAAKNWYALAATVAAMTYEEMEGIAAAARLKAGVEPRRLTDNLSDPKAQSPLHKINPGMLKMTWQGMAQLLELSRDFDVLPFADCAIFRKGAAEAATKCPSTRPKLMEVYPAAILKHLGLPHQKYKGKTPAARQLRREIISAVSSPQESAGGHVQKLRSVNGKHKFPLALALAAPLADLALDSDDALDSLLAAHGAAMAVLSPAGPETNSNICPPDCGTDAQNAELAARIAVEGWIYVPQASRP